MVYEINMFEGKGDIYCSCTLQMKLCVKTLIETKHCKNQFNVSNVIIAMLNKA